VIMALPVSSLSGICTAVADFVRTGLDAVLNDIDVAVGIPADATSLKHLVNLFFYKFEPSGFVLNTRPDEPWRIRIYCLITAIGITENSISAGENELRLIGEVLRIFHENPVLASADIGGEEVRLQVVYSHVSEDRINQIWSTQGDAVYHPSLAYEMSLTPVMPKNVWGGDPLVGSIGNAVLPDFDSRYDTFVGTALTPPVLPVVIDTTAPDWSPEICFIYEGACHKSLAFDMEASDFVSFKPEVWLAGKITTSVIFKWEKWDSTGWRDTGVTQTETPYSAGLDPSEMPPVSSGFPLELPLPEIPVASETAAQYLLYAVRTSEKFDGGQDVEIRSNPLLISLYRSIS